MSDEDKDARRIGRDEMNLCEFPIAALAERVPSGCKTLIFEDRHGRLTVIGSDAYGLPTALDSDVIVGLIQLTKLRNDFTDPTVRFSRYELVDLLGWADNGQNYRRLSESLHRWVTVTLKYDGCWWDNKRKRRVSASFHILDEVVLPDADDPGIESSFTWGKKFFKSCRDGNLKRLDMSTYFALKSAISKQLYRHLDKRFYLRPEWTYDLRELAFEHVGMSRNYTAAKLKEKLRPALDELEGIGFLEPMSAADRYSKTGRGAWNIRLVRKLPPPAEAPPAETKPPEPEPTGLERELVERGVTRSAAADLVRDFPAERIRRQVEVVDWLRETKPKRIKDLGAYLAKAIREDFATPAGFEGKAGRAARETAKRAALEREAEARKSKARAREIEAQIQAYWEALPPERRAALEAEALAGAAPADRAAYEAALAPPVRRLLQAGLRDAHLRRLLGLPAAD
ncbi:MAG TPA: replication initiator protein A [Isosphaeraceae bacterium]|nr:replication initiator protein A [Isosphaeraceae bacterium]